MFAFFWETCEWKHFLSFRVNKNKQGGQEEPTKDLADPWSYPTKSRESAADWTGGIRARTRWGGLIPGSLVYKHHRLTIQRIHQNIWAKPLAPCNPSSGRDPKLNLLSNHPSTNTVERVPLCKCSVVVKHSCCGCLFVKTSFGQPAGAPPLLEEEPQHSGLVTNSTTFSVLWTI